MDLLLLGLLQFSSTNPPQLNSPVGSCGLCQSWVGCLSRPACLGKCSFTPRPLLLKTSPCHHLLCSGNTVWFTLGSTTWFILGSTSVCSLTCLLPRLLFWKHNCSWSIFHSVSVLLFTRKCLLDFPPQGNLETLSYLVYFPLCSLCLLGSREHVFINLYLKCAVLHFVKELSVP